MPNHPNHHDTRSQHQAIVSAIDSQRLHEAISGLEGLIDDNAWTLRNRLEQIKTSYQFMLQYMSQGILDPKRDEVLCDMVNQLYTLADETLIARLEGDRPELFFAKRREMSSTTMSSLVEQYNTLLNKSALLTSVAPESRNQTAIVQILKQREQTETHIFNKIWSTFPTPSGDAELLRVFLNDEQMPEPARCLVVMALLLGLMCYWDETKLALLTDTYLAASSAEVQIRAIIAILLSLKAHRRRAQASRTLPRHFAALTEATTFADDVGMVLYRLIGTRNTDRVTKHVTQDLIPDIIKASPQMMRKLRERPDEIDLSEPEANPEWQQMLEDSGLAGKMEEFTQLQMEGSDVFISTFARLKTFPFFQTLSNWFLPYHEQHSSVIESLGEQEQLLRYVVARAPFLCNSDRYSFCLSLQAMPEAQRRMMLEQSGHQMAELKEMDREAGMAGHHVQRDTIATRCVQDLYRFFNLFSRRREFLPGIDDDMDFSDLPFINAYTSGETTLEVIAEFYLKNGFDEEAIRYFDRLLEVQHPTRPIIYQKIGFAHERMGNLRQALRQYHRYELANEQDTWTLRHMAGCCRALGRTDEAMDYYARLERQNPDNVSTVLNMGHTLLEAGRTEQALQQYYKADLMADNRHRARRPVAWCLFVLGNHERSIEYYDRIIMEDTPTMSDHLNRGHVHLCMGHIDEALDDYRKAYALSGTNPDTFRKAMIDDTPHLTAKDIEPTDILLITDLIVAPSQPIL